MIRTRSERLLLGGAGMAALLIAVLGWFFLIGPQRSQTRDIQDQVSSAQLQGTTLQARIASLTSETRRMATYRRALRTAQRALPSTDDLGATPDFLTALQSIGRATSTSVISLDVGDPAAVEATVAATAPSASPSSSPSSSDSPSSTAPAAAQPPAADVYSVAITATVAGAPQQLSRFLARLQTGQRALFVSAITISAHASLPGVASSATTLNLTMNAFVRPGTAAAAAAAAAPTPTPTGTP